MRSSIAPFLLTSLLTLSCGGGGTDGSGGGGGGSSNSSSSSSSSSSSNSSSSNSSSSGARELHVELEGAVQQGPFVVGRTIQIAPLHDDGNPPGTSFSTQTRDDLGQFNVDFSASGL